MDTAKPLFLPFAALVYTSRSFRTWIVLTSPARMHERTSAMRICLFEDHGHAALEPLSLTRPVFDLLCGLDSLAAKQCRLFAPCTVGTLVRPHLADLCRLRDCRTPVNDV